LEHLVKLGETYSRGPLELVRPNTFPYEVLIVDGQGRSGKNLISVLLSTMERVEKMRLDSQLDYIPRYYFLGKLALDAAVVALRTEVDEKLYYNAISRDVNFRFSDYTGVLKQGKRLMYVKRLWQPAEADAVARMAAEQPIFQSMTHDGLHVAPLYFAAFGSRLKLVHVFRDPVGNIYEQNRRDFGTRMGTDPREFQLVYDWHGQPVPLIALGLEDRYLAGNPTERLVLMVNQMFRLNLQGARDLASDARRRVYFLEFEQFLVDPRPDMEALERFVGVPFTRARARILKRERCPRTIDQSERHMRIEHIERHLSPWYLSLFQALVTDYDDKPWLHEVAV
jgi:hypothetical protein